MQILFFVVISRPIQRSSIEGATCEKGGVAEHLGR
jgi:hypothetical protein